MDYNSSINFPKWKSSGYFIMLQHDLEEIETLDTTGFHVYLHEPREKFTEHGILSSGRIEYFFMEANEELELKLTVQHFTQLRGRGSSCSDDNMRSLSIVSSLRLSFYEKTNLIWLKTSISYFCSAAKCVDGRQSKRWFHAVVLGCGRERHQNVTTTMTYETWSSRTKSKKFGSF